ncbi:hypothetical protein RYX36_001374, partial [Vicia faba]
NGGIRIGFDIGIGSGSFAAVMYKRNVTRKYDNKHGAFERCRGVNKSYDNNI